MGQRLIFAIGNRYRTLVHRPASARVESSRAASIRRDRSGAAAGGTAEFKPASGRIRSRQDPSAGNSEVFLRRGRFKGYPLTRATCQRQDNKYSGSCPDAGHSSNLLHRGDHEFRAFLRTGRPA